MAKVIAPHGPAFKVAASGPARIRGRNFTGVIIDDLDPPNPWKKYKLKLMPKRINGVWYKPGDWVYRKRVHGPGGATWIYGDDFDFMRGK